MTDIKNVSPLTPAVFYILLSLVKGQKHGYEIMKNVKEDTQGKVRMGNGTLYGSVKRMLSACLIEDAGDTIDPDNERRKYYRITELGRKTLNIEMQRYIDTVSVIKARNLVPNVSIKFSI